LKKTHYSQTIYLTPVDNQRLGILCGQFDEHLRAIEADLDVEISNRGHEFHILGEKKSVRMAVHLLQNLYTRTAKVENLSLHELHQSLREARENKANASSDFLQFESEDTYIQLRRGILLKPHSDNQRLYIENMRQFPITFGIGPAGTGKTYLAVACAVAALEKEEVSRILLIRPAVEAGERLGFLPGDLAQKVDPYLRPLYDALYEMLGPEQVTRLIERRIIEIAPLAFMRGRTLSNAFIILDEAQNTTREQMKMFLTRMGYNAVTVITGDITQIDLPNNTPSGLKHALEVLDGISGIGLSFFNSKDTVRHALVQVIIEAYDRFEKK
jgi:phosphate starvation-inducible PhoH-like protein